MKKPALGAILLCLAPWTVQAAIEAGDQLISADVGALKMTGPDRNYFTGPGWFAGADYFYQYTNAFAVGAEASWSQPHGKGAQSIVRGNGTAVLDSQAYSLAALGRWNFLPAWDWTPYVAAGPGLYYLSQNVKATFPKFPSLNTEQGSYYWRISGLAAIGVDYSRDDWLLGAQMRFQTFSSDAGDLVWTARLGYRFGNRFFGRRAWTESASEGRYDRSGERSRRLEPAGSADDGGIIWVQ